MASGDKKSNQRRPGRPPNRPAAPSQEKKGITEAPSDNRFLFELVSSNPESFKALMKRFKSLGAEHVYLSATQKRIDFLTRDHEQRTRVIATYAGLRAQMYYCKEPTRVRFLRTNADDAFSSVDNTKYLLSLAHRQGDMSLVVRLNDALLDTVITYEIKLQAYGDGDADLFSVLDMQVPVGPSPDYSLQLSVSAKCFKKIMSDISRLGTDSVVNFDKYRDSPLRISAHSDTVTCNVDFNNAEKIKLICPASSALFRCSVRAGPLKMLADALPAGTMRLLCRESDHIIVQALGDEDSAMTVSAIIRLGI